MVYIVVDFLTIGSIGKIRRSHHESQRQVEALLTKARTPKEATARNKPKAARFAEGIANSFPESHKSRQLMAREVGL